jgi:hypothetical protein
MKKDLSVRPAQTAVPLSCSFLLLIGYAIQHLAGNLIWNGCGELFPLFLAIYP